MSDVYPLRLEYLDPAELDSNPANWRTHPHKLGAFPFSRPTLALCYHAS